MTDAEIMARLRAKRPEELTTDEREVVIRQLRVEALEELRQMGCTCQPKMELTNSGVGPYHLPAWTSDHDEDVCALAIAFGDVQRMLGGGGVSGGPGGTDGGLDIGSSTSG